MKKIFTIGFTLIGLIARSQAYISPEAGYSTNKSLQVSMQAGYQFQRVQLEGDLRTNLDRRSPALLGARLGYEIPIGSWSIAPLASYYFKMVSTDKKSLNGFLMGAGLRLRAGNGATLQCSYADKTIFIGVGFKG